MPPQEYTEICLTCRENYNDPLLKEKIVQIKRKLQTILKTSKSHLRIKKVEPWNSVRVTIDIPKSAAVRLKQLADQGHRRLRELGILDVQIPGQNMSANSDPLYLRVIETSADNSPAFPVSTASRKRVFDNCVEQNKRSKDNADRMPDTAHLVSVLQPEFSAIHNHEKKPVQQSTIKACSSDTSFRREDTSSTGNIDPLLNVRIKAARREIFDDNEGGSVSHVRQKLENGINRDSVSLNLNSRLLSLSSLSKTAPVPTVFNGVPTCVAATNCEGVRQISSLSTIMSMPLNSTVPLYSLENHNPKSTIVDSKANNFLSGPRKQEGKGVKELKSAES